jgi:hypothetical protein
VVTLQVEDPEGEEVLEALMVVLEVLEVA